MSDKEITILLVYLCGFYSLAFGIFHLFFPKLFKWKTDLAKLTNVNRGIVYILNLRLTYIFFLISLICLIFPIELISTKLGNVLLLGLSVFWLVRTIEQFIFLNIESKAVHILTAIFIFGTFLFASPVAYKLIVFQPCKVEIRK